MEFGTIFLIVIGAVLLIALIALLGGGVAMGGMMMAGMMATPAGWLILLILVALIALIGLVLLSPGGSSASAQAFVILSMIGLF